MLKLVSQIHNGIYSLLYPTQCRVCGGLVDSYADGVACAACWQKQQFFQANFCGRCGLQFQDNPQTERPERICNRCREFEFSFARSCGNHHGALRVNLLYLKSYPHICRRLRQIIKQTFAQAVVLHPAEVIIPLPLHSARLKERGFNQALLIANILARQAHLPIDRFSLQKIKATERHRAGTDALERTRSVARAFTVKYPEQISGKRILLVDDVFTTGSTLNECARILKKAGAAEVMAFTLARVI